MSYSKSSKFKVGDKVVAVENADENGNHYLHPHLCCGSVYEVTKVCNGIISVSGFFVEGNGENWSEDWFKPYEEKEVKVENTMTAESLRNSILSLQQERVSLQEQIEQNITQEKSLTEQLKWLGFLLVENKGQPTNVVDEKKAVLYAEDIEEDMTDSRNWKKGDFVSVINRDRGDPFELGDVVKLLEACKTPYCSGEKHSKWAMLSEQLKFHSRPVTN